MFHVADLEVLDHLLAMFFHLSLDARHDVNGLVEVLGRGCLAGSDTMNLGVVVQIGVVLLQEETELIAGQRAVCDFLDELMAGVGLPVGLDTRIGDQELKERARVANLRNQTATRAAGGTAASAAHTQCVCGVTQVLGHFLKRFLDSEHMVDGPIGQNLGLRYRAPNLNGVVHVLDTAVNGMLEVFTERKIACNCGS